MSRMRIICVLLGLTATQGCSNVSIDPEFGRYCGSNSNDVCSDGLQCIEGFCTELCTPVQEGLADCRFAKGSCVLTVSSDRTTIPLCYPKCGEASQCTYGSAQVYRGSCICIV